ncbi:hypothetical protein EV182_001632 [Spiromyces aspiralis]|uniref:Uncharacterized protein n=1 Tax=Spiromyces aspiralis TaxID=68401 RepID=A0ACC1HT62_9FUNG|nr:hypothetical protein EV182_001632 [Spiromyces aspiralis]
MAPESPLDRPRASPLPTNMVRRGSLGGHFRRLSYSVHDEGGSRSISSSPTTHMFGSRHDRSGANGLDEAERSDEMDDAQIARKYRSLCVENSALRRRNDDLQKALLRAETDLLKVQQAHEEAEKRAQSQARWRERDAQSYRKQLDDLECRSNAEIERLHADAEDLRRRLYHQEQETVESIAAVKRECDARIEALEVRLRSLQEQYAQMSKAKHRLDTKHADALRRIQELEPTQAQIDALLESAAELEKLCLSQRHTIFRVQAESEELRRLLASGPSISAKPSYLSVLYSASSTDSLAGARLRVKASMRSSAPQSHQDRGPKARAGRTLHRRSRSEILLTVADILELNAEECDVACEAEETKGAQDNDESAHSLIENCNLRPIRKADSSEGPLPHTSPGGKVAGCSSLLVTHQRPQPPGTRLLPELSPATTPQRPACPSAIRSRRSCSLPAPSCCAMWPSEALQSTERKRLSVRSVRATFLSLPAKPRLYGLAPLHRDRLILDSMHPVTQHHDSYALALMAFYLDSSSAHKVYLCVFVVVMAVLSAYLFFTYSLGDKPWRVTNNNA